MIIFKEEIIMNISYIKHSGVLVETKNSHFLFDYIGGVLPLLKQNTNIFVSHAHEDHFSSKIFSLPSTEIFLSDDIKSSKKVTLMAPDEYFERGDFTIHTFGSTDQGVSILLNTKEGVVFFAADLNDWYWEEEDSHEDMIAMETAFLAEIRKASSYSIDVLCFPVDPRLGTQYDKGAKKAIEILQPKAFLPIHFWKDYTLLKIFNEKYKHQCRILLPTEEGSVFSV